MKVTKQRVQAFDANAEVWLNQQKNKESKFLYALRKVKKKVKRIVEDYTDELNELRVSFASVDEKTKNILTKENGSFEFTSDQHKILAKKLREAGRVEVEIEHHFVKEEDLPDDLPYSYQEIFTDFVIKDEEDQSAEQPQV